MALLLTGIDIVWRCCSHTHTQAEHIDTSTLDVIAQLIERLRAVHMMDDDGADAHASKLFLLLAVRSRDGLQDERMRGWVDDVTC